MIQGRSLELYFIDGQPDGLLTAEVFNWTGHVLQIPRTRLKDALARREASHTGVYLLLGENENGPLAYIGESEDVGQRLKSHAVEKDWWDLAILITSAANNLHKAHVKYLESRLVELAREAQQIPLENGNTPPRASLAEADVANMETFLGNLTIVLPAIRVDLLVNKTRPLRVLEDEIAKPPPTEVEFNVSYPKFGVEAAASLVDGELIVQAGSRVRTEWVGKGSWDSGYRKIRDKLIATGVIRVSEGNAKFIENYAFSSPSAAAAVVLGRASNGRQEWHLSGTDRTYADWEEKQLLQAEAPE